MDELMIKIDHISKQYILGQIGGTTLRDELQRFHARIRHQEDPTKQVGSRDYNKGDKFLALDDISLEIKKGERVGIIGHNGAGKSTMLKLLSRVTAPTAGTIGLNGRVASMLEVGTGFHGELTGRENIYMNGAILGMSKKEIDRKIEDIIDFSECRQFIDTPVKRYSSGMYVKLAFSVAAHLDSEIMIMDEVLAVGDMAFQTKCLDKMNDVSMKEGRTILYVSHNMNTIRRLCDRCIVLSHGHVIFDGGVEDGIATYMNNALTMDVCKTFSEEQHRKDADRLITIEQVEFMDKSDLPIYQKGEKIHLKALYDAEEDIDKMAFRWTIHSAEGTRAGMATTSPCINAKKGKNTNTLIIPLDWLAPGKYIVDLVAYTVNQYGNDQLHDVVNEAFIFEKDMTVEENNKMEWHHSWWGYVMFPEIEVEEICH